MGVHDPDLTPEETGAFGPLEILLRSSVVGHRPIEQVSAIRTHQLFTDQGKVSLRLSWGEHVVDDRVDHCQNAVGQAGHAVARMKQEIGFSAFVEIGESREDVIHD